MSLTRDQILSAGDREIQTISVPEWGGDVSLRPLSGREAVEIYEGNPDSNTIVRRVVVLSMCDDHGNRLFSTADADAVFDRSATAVDRLVTPAMAINRMDGDPIGAAKKA